MTTDYSRGVLRLVVAQMCQTVGWHSINSTPLEFLVDLMHEYLLRISRLTHQYCEVVGRTEPNLDDLGLAFRHMNINIEELSEYVRNVDSIPCPISVPKLPVARENHLNFLKPGSREVVTRPVHVHEHLPAMYPETEEDYPAEKSETLTNGLSESPESNGLSAGAADSLSPQGVFKRPGDPVSFESPITKRPKLTEEGRPLREIHSVMMTTSGFLSPAREGKLPEARTPQQVRADSPPPSSYPMVPPELKSDKKPKKIVKKTPEARKLDKENKKKNRVKELFKPDEVKKLTGMKELAKLKALKPGGGKTPGPSGTPSAIKAPKTSASPKQAKNAQSKVKAEKIIDVSSTAPPPDKKQESIDKLPSEPDKRKLNIFKKISKPEKETEQHKHKDVKVSRENSPSLISDVGERSDIEVKREEKKTPHTPDVVLPDGDVSALQSSATYAYTFDNMSPPGTPSTPKTPELSLPLPVETKKKKRERIAKKKEPKIKTLKSVNTKKTKMMVEPLEMDLTDRTKIPQRPESPLHHHHHQQHHPPPPPLPQPPPIIREPHNLLPFSFFPPFPAPGLIPPPIGHPMFPRFPLPLPKGITHTHPGMANLPIPPRFLNPPMKLEDYSMGKAKAVDREKYAPIIPPAKPEKIEKEKNEKIAKIPDKELILPVTSAVVPPPVINTPPVVSPLALPIVPPVPTKHAKLEKVDKKSKEHKKEKKDKIKKKKDKKEKHKEKGEKVKKEKGEKKEKLEKIKEKKEKREKRKEKDLNKKTVKEEKAVIPHEIAVPKLTLKLGTSSPRPPTPDSAPMKKITIKPLLKKPEEEAIKREPSPELAKISALVTRPPKQKAPSKKSEEGNIDLYPALSSESSFSSSLSLSSTPRTKRPIFKPLASPPIYSYPKTPSPPLQQQQSTFFYVDQSGNQIWICPACGSQDDGSPMVGCDDCDAWYHWVCVGMQVPPASNEDWYCRQCLSKKQELHHDKKKKKGKKKKVKMPA
ncbi:transcription initiation factor TFIID subunit 3 isoform X1 [Leptopilina heterotoma]|uniref:transcription initiation factor TFIID subunit 3 isoform X1 n=1 Tax=Leptopilina heterotoma TaxID=63436 RepID=UPI001CA90000|nr:transcription initiation factor TFIID subunit 3 isoform X1 [Leptopilina heterotoma]XP_043468257.1 transcription initiation factor TFIID subunit 3 isoform X1 [Leptopilina heterotoma]